MEPVFLLFALGFLGVLIFGSILGIVAALRVSRVAKVNAELAERLTRLEAAAGADASTAAAPKFPTKVEADTAAQAPSAPVERPVLVRTEDDASEERVPTTPSTVSPFPARGLDLESMIAGRWLNRIGIVAVLLAVAFFLKFAFDNDWVGPTGRVAIGLLAGTGLLVGSQRLFGKGYTYFSEGIAALGGGVLFLSIFAAFDFYQLIPQPAAFVSLLAVTAALGGLALGRDSERLAVLALGAGFATPGLLGTDEQLPLFTFVAILVACFLFAAWRKGWRWVAPVALLGTLIYLFGWYEDSYSAKRLLPTLAFCTLFFAEFATYLLLRTSVDPDDARRPRTAELLLFPVNAGWYGLILYLLLYEDHRWWLTAAAIVLGALHLGAARLVTAGDPEKTHAARLVLAGLALTFVTAAIPIRLEGKAITVAWAIEGALLVWGGFRANVKALRLAGMALLLTVIVLLVAQSGATERLLLNARFLSFAVVVVALGLSAYWARSRWDELGRDERLLFDFAGIAVNGVAVWGLSEEIWYALGRQQLELDTKLARQMGLSVLWAVTASLLILVGARWKSAALRWQGLVLLGLTVIKVFVLDLSFLERAYRIASFLVLGVVLLVVSFWYQKSLARADEDDARENDRGGALDGSSAGDTT